MNKVLIIGYHVDTADNGLEAIEIFQKNQYDAVLMDVHMPGCNGLEATSQIRKHELKNKTHVPIIAVTASVADEIACAKAGMDGLELSIFRILMISRFYSKTDFKTCTT
jgi:CheY-like chemotaxis protein